MRTIVSIIAILALTGCAGKYVPVEKIVTKEVPVPYHTPCPAPQDIPTQPARLASETPALPKLPGGEVDWMEASRLLAAKVGQWISYGEKADGVMQACAK